LDARSFSPHIAGVVERLISALRRVPGHGEAWNFSEIGFTAADFICATTQDVALLVNDWTLGFGQDQAPILALGTEQAYSASDPTELVIWNCCCSPIWSA